MQYGKILLCYVISLFAAFVAVDAVITVLYGYQVVDFLLDDGLMATFMIDGDGVNFVAAAIFYLVADLILIIASKVGGGLVRFPKYANPLVTLFWWIVILLILPIYGGIKSAIELVKILFMFLWWLLTKKKGDKLNWSSGKKVKTSGSSGKNDAMGGQKKLKAFVRDICAQYERGYNKSVGAQTRMDCTIRPSVFGNGVDIKVDLRFTIRTDIVNTAYDMQAENDTIRNIVRNFPSANIQKAILAEIRSLAQDHLDVYGEYAVNVDVDYDVKTV